jgi:hypothetical protein
MSEEPNSKKISVIYKFENFTREAEVNKFGTLRDIRKVLEKQINLSVKQMNMIYHNNNIMNVSESTKIYNYFGDVNEIILEMKYKDFVEDDYKLVFEKAFAQATIPDDKKSKRKMKHLKSLRNKEDYVPEIKERKVCNYDQLNEAKYICLKCSQLWCEHCLKFEIHKNEISPLDQLDNTLQHKRRICIKNLEEKITTDPYFDKLEKIDFILNEKVSVIDKQFDDLINLIKKIKENQMKFIIDYYYTKISDKKYSSLFKDTKFYRKTMKDIDTTYKSDQIDLNLKNMRTMEDGLLILVQKFEEFKLKYGDFDRLFLQFHGFNQTFISQIEAKVEQNTKVGRSLDNPEELDKLTTIKKDFDTIVKHKNRGTSLIKIKYYNSIMIWNHLNQKLIRVNDFIDNCEFKLNYQVFAGNIFLNLKNKLFIITGSNFNMFFFYDPIKNQIYRLPSLKENHCRGGLIYVKYFNSILCISGKYTKKVEVFKLDEFNINNFKDDGKYNGSKYHKDGGGNYFIKRNSKISNRRRESKSNSKSKDLSVSNSKSLSKNKDKDYDKASKMSKSKSKTRPRGRNSVAISRDESKSLSKDFSMSRTSKKYKTKKEASHSHSKNKRTEESKNTIESGNTNKKSKNNEKKSNYDTKSRKSSHHDTKSRKSSHRDTKSRKSSRYDTKSKKSHHHSKDKQPQNLDYLKDDKLYWEEFPELNYARNYSCFYIHNDYYLYVFFGYNQYRGNLDTIEKIDLREPENKWQIIKYENPSKLDLHLASMSVCYAGVDEIYILGGSIHDTPTDQIIKYNFKQNAFFLTEMTIPGIRENEYFRFWEESTFVPLTSKGNATNADDEFTFGLIDARDKVHLYNIRNFKYNII